MCTANMYTRTRTHICFVFVCVFAWVQMCCMIVYVPAFSKLSVCGFACLSSFHLACMHPIGLLLAGGGMGLGVGPMMSHPFPAALLIPGSGMLSLARFLFSVPPFVLFPFCCGCCRCGCHLNHPAVASLLLALLPFSSLRSVRFDVFLTRLYFPLSSSCLASCRSSRFSGGNSCSAPGLFFSDIFFLSPIVCLFLFFWR